MRNQGLLVVGLVLALGLVCLGSLLIVGGLAARGAIVLPGGLLAQASTAASTPLVTPPPGGPNTGAPATNFSAAGIDNKTVQLGQFRGKPVILNFWATWCGPCSAEMPNFEKVYEQHQNDIVILAVNQGETAEQVSGYADIYRLHFPLLLDQHMQTGNLYHVIALPTTVFIDAQGVIQEVHIGGPMSVDYIEGRIKKLLGQ